MKRRNFALLLFLMPALGMIWQSCRKDDDVLPQSTGLTLPDQPYDYKGYHQGFKNAFHFFNDNTPVGNRITNDGATLGRVLFYDPRMSVNNAVSCASCHRQERGFADNKAFSNGFANKITPRNSMAINNLSLHSRFFWDLRTHSLEEQVLEPVENHIEMGMEKVEDLPPKLSNLDYYPELFEAAFGNSTITTQKISLALSQFLRSMVAYDSKYDKGRENEFQNFSAKEKLGRTLFVGKAGCNNCHSEPFFIPSWGSDATNIGLDEDYEDEGIENGLFKIPSLRNIALTAPYMHDGRFATLKDVIEHYNAGVKNHPFLDWRLQDFSNNSIEPRRLHLTDLEIEALEAFLNTLTDRTLSLDPMFSSPF